MPLKKRTVKKYGKFNLPLSYRINETDPKLRDSANVYSGQDRLIKRNGATRYNSESLGSSVLSTSFFKKSDNTKKILAKADTVLYSVNELVSNTSIKTGLTSTTKHRALTMRDKHIIAIESDGLFQYDGTTFTQLGQAVPIAPTVTAAAGGSLENAKTYTIKLAFYSSSTGFETNGGDASSSLLIAASNQTIDITAIPTTADNATIDTVYIYMKKESGSYLFVKEISLGTALTSITADTDSTQVPQTKHAAPRSGGAKYLASFNGKLVTAGSSTYPNDIFFSEQDLPDAFDDSGSATQLVLYAEGVGPVTGITTGFYSDGNIEPYLVIFKKSSIEIYSERGGFSRRIMIDPNVGCVSADTIEIRDGNIFFLSERGWRVIVDGRLIKDSKGNSITLGSGDIDDIFTSPGFEYEINSAQFENFHSVYYPVLDQYVTWISEGVSTDKKKAYVYEFSSSNGFKVYTFSINATCSCVAENDDGDKIVIYGSDNGYLHKHSIGEQKNDVDTDGGQESLSTFALINWTDGDDYDSTYNFRELIVRGVAEIEDVEVRAAVNRDSFNYNSNTMNFDIDTESGFVLDISLLDVGVFGDSRVLVTDRADINRTGRDISIGFYQDVLNGDMQLASYQLNFNKNGNNNI